MKFDENDQRLDTLSRTVDSRINETMVIGL